MVIGADKLIEYGRLLILPSDVAALENVDFAALVYCLKYEEEGNFYGKGIAEFNLQYSNMLFLSETPDPEILKLTNEKRKDFEVKLHNQLNNG